MARIDQLAHRDLIGDVGKDGALALVQQSTVHPVGRGGKADHLEHGVDALELGQKARVHGAGVAPNQMRFINQHQIALLHVVDAPVDGLNSGEQNLGADFSLI
jgi:hypothetical protein